MVIFVNYTNGLEHHQSNPRASSQRIASVFRNGALRSEDSLSRATTKKMLARRGHPGYSQLFEPAVV